MASARRPRASWPRPERPCWWSPDRRNGSTTSRHRSTPAAVQAVAYPTDLTDETAVSALTKQITEDHGPLDIVVSNAGKSLRRSLHQQYDRPHDFQRTIDINYLGPIWLLLGVLPAMRENGRGHIVNVSSVGVRVVPGPQWGAYQASKGAFDRWLRSVAPELHSDGVDVTSVYFALVRTRMIEPTPMLGRLARVCLRMRPPTRSPKRSSSGPARIEPPWVWPAELASVLLAGPGRLRRPAVAPSVLRRIRQPAAG